MSFQITADGRVKVYVDGCYVPGSSRGGIGIWFNYNHHLNGDYTVSTWNKDSNDVEFMAAQYAVDIFEERYNNGLFIYTDSQHVVYYKDSLKSDYVHVVQRLDDHHEGIREAHKLARRGAGIY